MYITIALTPAFTTPLHGAADPEIFGNDVRSRFTAYVCMQEQTDRFSKDLKNKLCCHNHSYDHDFQFLTYSTR
jgi:hypothetical protein